MSHFYGNMQGSRGETTRCGTQASGICADIRGYNIGVQTECFVDDDGEDKVRITLTGGTNAQCAARELGTFKRRGNKIIQEHSK
jgi:hypothetical protein